MTSCAMQTTMFAEPFTVQERGLLRAMLRRTCPISCAEAAAETGLPIDDAEAVLRNLAATALTRWDYRLPLRHAGWTLTTVGAHIASCVERDDAPSANAAALQRARTLSRDIAIRTTAHAPHHDHDQNPGALSPEDERFERRPR